MTALSDTQGTTPNRTDLIVRGRLGEGIAYNATIKPGMLVQPSAGKYIPHNVANGGGEAIVALEDGFRGYPKDVNDAYETDCIFPLAHLVAGDVIWGRLAAAAAAIAVDDMVVSAGDGTFKYGTGSQSTLLYDNTAASAAVTGVATITAFDKSYTFAANALKVGDCIRFKAQGIATATNSTDTLVITMKIGSTTLIATTAVDVADNDEFLVTGDLIIRTIGASGTFVGSGNWNVGVPGTATTRAWLKASTAIDTTASQALTVSATWSTSSGSNSCRLDMLQVELLRGLGPDLVFKALEAVDNSLGASDTRIKLRYVG